MIRESCKGAMLKGLILFIRTWLVAEAHAGGANPPLCKFTPHRSMHED